MEFDLRGTPAPTLTIVYTISKYKLGNFQSGGNIAWRWKEGKKRGIGEGGGGDSGGRRVRH